MLKVDRFGPVFKQIHDALEKNANNLLRADDLTMAQVHLLFLLEESPDGCYSLKELERRLRVAQSTMVGVVKRSAQKGFVECYGDPHDKRVKHFWSCFTKFCGTSRNIPLCVWGMFFG